jgi:hypothetical protein
MEDILRKKIRSIIQEMESQEVDEMADWKKMHGITKNFEKIKDRNDNLVGWNVQGTPILFTCGVDIDSFMNQHPEIMEHLKEKFGENLKWVNKNLPACQPRTKLDVKSLPNSEEGGKMIDTTYVHSGQMQGERERILRKLNTIIIEKLENEEVSKQLELCSIPTIKGRERTNIDRHSEISNFRINYKTHTFNSYETAPDFLKAVIARIKGEVPKDFEEYYLARQFNKKNRNWGQDKKNQKRWEGLTQIYQLKKFGFEEKNLDVTVAMFLEINGEMVQGGLIPKYQWEIKFKTEHGKKIKDDVTIHGGFIKDKDIKINKSVELDPETKFSNEKTVLDNISIVSALIESLDELKNKIMDFNPKEVLKIANVRQYNVKKIQEQKSEYIFKKIIKQLKK